MFRYERQGVKCKCYKICLIFLSPLLKDGNVVSSLLIGDKWTKWPEIDELKHPYVILKYVFGSIAAGYTFFKRTHRLETLGLNFFKSPFYAHHISG